MPTKVDVSACHGAGGHQLIRLNTEGQLGIGERCVEVDHSGRLELIYCPEGTAAGSWNYDEKTKQVIYSKSGLCVEMQSDDSLALRPCGTEKAEQKWEWRAVKAH